MGRTLFCDLTSILTSTALNNVFWNVNLDGYKWEK